MTCPGHLRRPGPAVVMVSASRTQLPPLLLRPGAAGPKRLTFGDPAGRLFRAGLPWSTCRGSAPSGKPDAMDRVGPSSMIQFQPSEILGLALGDLSGGLADPERGCATRASARWSSMQTMICIVPVIKETSPWRCRSSVGLITLRQAGVRGPTCSASIPRRSGVLTYAPDQGRPPEPLQAMVNPMGDGTPAAYQPRQSRWR